MRIYKKIPDRICGSILLFLIAFPVFIIFFKTSLLNTIVNQHLFYICTPKTKINYDLNKINIRNSGYDRRKSGR